MNVAILGAGNAGFAFAAHMSYIGNSVFLYENEKFKKNIEKIQETKQIFLTGKIEGSGIIQLASSNIKDIVSNADLIFISVPGFAQETVFKEYLPHAKPGDIVMFCPGNYAALRFQNLLKEKGLENDVTLAESYSMPYAARKTSDNTVYMLDIKTGLSAAALPASRTNTVIEKLNLIMDGFFYPVSNVLETSLGNPNCIMHCPTAVLNAGWIESDKDFSFYWDGASPSVSNVIKAVDKERIDIGKMLGFELPGLDKTLKTLYNLKGNDLYEVIQNSRHGESGGPDTLKSRYLIEDVPYGLVPISALGKMLGIATPTADSIIKLSSLLNQSDYTTSGLNSTTLGLKGLSADQLKNLVSG
jgi:opine dehydrogenase